MPDDDRSRPRVATCEDWDDSTGAVVADVQAHVTTSPKKKTPALSSKGSYERTRRNGSDSGYSSKAGTVNSDPFSVESVREAGIPERERAPYSMAKERPEVKRLSSDRPKTYVEDSEKPRRIKHLDGCDVCNHYGWHAVGRETSRSSMKPESPKAARATASKLSSEDTLPRTTRRLSSNARQRPVTMYGALPSNGQYFANNAPSQIAYAPPLLIPNGWSNPGSPIAQYSPVVYTQTFAQMPATAPHGAYEVPTYFEHPQHVPQIHAPKPERRLTSHGQHGKPLVKQKSRSRSPEKHRVPLDERPHNIAAQAFSHDADRMKMPPPPRPETAEIILARRPSMKKTVSYATTTSTASSNRRSMVLDDTTIPDLAATAAAQQQRSSPSRPPSSYRGPSFPESERERPVLSKANTYASPSHVVMVAAAAASVDRPRISGLARRTTLSSVPSAMTSGPRNPSPVKERYEMEAEAYQSTASRSRGSFTSNDLTAEALAMRKQNNARRGISERSETGSSRSHQSRGSGSGRSSGARGSSKDRSHARNSIILSVDGKDMVIPLIDADGKDVRQIKVTTATQQPPEVTKEPVVGNLPRRSTYSDSRTQNTLDWNVDGRYDNLRQDRAPSSHSRTSDQRENSRSRDYNDQSQRLPDRGATPVSRRPSQESDYERNRDLQLTRRVEKESRHRRNDTDDTIRGSDFPGNDYFSATSQTRNLRQREGSSSSRSRRPSDQDDYGHVRPTAVRSKTDTYDYPSSSSTSASATTSQRRERSQSRPRSQSRTGRPRPSSTYYDGDPNDFAAPNAGETVVRRYSIREDHRPAVFRPESRSRSRIGDRERSHSRPVVLGERSRGEERSQSRRRDDRERVREGSRSRDWGAVM